ncbi:MarR family transcriptional regulator [Companilactobacillus mishanensis]|uniref:MarR family winged helix-turn-helix transcriptional regulator n=1 Tax=Companilactobacillus mishanensis TaxID=2486008 RepID=UPI0012D6474B|nr:MarR family transcriptional regulator [Companilactobacillus mishanensis]
MEEILRPIGMIARSLDSISNVEFKDIGLTRGQYLYLVRIEENPGIILEKLANIVKIDKTTAARAVQKLEKQGLIKRTSDEANMKIKHLFTTDKGKKIYPLIKRENDYSNQVALKGLSVEEQRLLSEYLLKVADNINQDWEFVKSGGRRKY